MRNVEAADIRQLQRRTLLKGLGVSTLALAGLSACSDGGGGAAQPGEIAPKGTTPKGSLRVTVFGTDQSYINAFRDLFKQFKADYPQVDLQVRGIAADNWGTYFNTVSTQIAGGDPPDVVQVATEGQRLFASKGLVAPIDAYMKRDAAEMKSYFSDVDPHFRQQVDLYERIEGNTYYLPGAFNTMCMWCNTDLFKRAGLDEPTNEWTWDDFESACRKIKAVDSGIFPYAARNGGAGYFTGIEPWLLTNSANVLSKDWSSAQMGSDNAIAAVEFNRKMIVDKLAPAPGGEFDMFSAVAQGQVAMIGGGRWPIVSFQDLDFIEPLKIVAWPSSKTKGTPVGWNSYGILNGSSNKEAAWALVKFMTSKEAERAFAKGGGTVVPSRESVATSDAYLSGSPEGTEELYNALGYATVIPAPNRTNELELTLTDGLEQILTGNIGVEQGCRQLDEEIQSVLEG